MIEKTKYTIYWTLGRLPCSEETNDMNKALQRIEELRRSPGYSAICFVAENPNQIGRMGVDAVIDGKTPDGMAYTWVKRREASA
jgi:hypothetical protein